MAIGFKGAAIEMKQALGHVCRSLAIMAGDTAQMMVRAAVVALVPCIESRIVSRRAESSRRWIQMTRRTEGRSPRSGGVSCRAAG